MRIVRIIAGLAVYLCLCGFGGGGGSGSGGGGSGTVTGVTGTPPLASSGSSTTPVISLSYDPTLGIGTGSLLGLNVTPEQYGALGNTKPYFAGAMTSGSSTLTDSTNSPFASAAVVGDYVCVAGASATTITDHAGTRHVELCGTISSWNSTSSVGLSFSNGSGGSISSVMYAFGALDQTAFQAAENGACNAGGGTVWLTHTYGMNATVTKCATSQVNWVGLGSNYLYGSGNSPAQNIPTLGGALWWLTSQQSATPLSGDGVDSVGVNGKTVQQDPFRITNVGIIAGVGSANYDGGSSTSNGWKVANWNGASFDHVLFAGWGQYGFYTDVLANSPANYVAALDFNHVIWSQNFQGLQFGSSVTRTDSGFMQNIHIYNSSAIVNSLEDGIKLQYNNIKALVIDGANTIQGNDEVASANYTDIDANNSYCQGCAIRNNYMETDWSNEIAYSIFPGNGADEQSADIEGNFVECVNGGGSYSMYFGNTSSQRAVNFSIKNNVFSACSATPIVLNAVAGVSAANNGGLDPLDIYDSTNNQLAFVVKNTGNVVLGNPVTVASLPATCVKGDVREVTDATSLTPGTCTGSGSDATIAVCSATNTWSCL